MTERIYGRDFDDDPNTTAQNTSIRFINEDVFHLNFSHPAIILAKKVGDYGKARGTYTIHRGEALHPCFEQIHEKDPSVLGNVLQHLQDLRNDGDFSNAHGELVDYGISLLNTLVHPEPNDETSSSGWLPLTPPPHPRTSSEAVDVYWFKHIRESNS